MLDRTKPSLSLPSGWLPRLWFMAVILALTWGIFLPTQYSMGPSTTTVQDLDPGSVLKEFQCLSLGTDQDRVHVQDSKRKQRPRGLKMGF